MVAVAQLVESRIVIPVVVGSSPISHPTFASCLPDADTNIVLHSEINEVANVLSTSC